MLLVVTVSANATQACSGDPTPDDDQNGGSLGGQGGAGETPGHGGNPEVPEDGSTCNALFACDLAYGTTMTVATHASAASAAAAWITQAQNLSLAEQLGSDALALSLEVFEDGGDLVVCAGDCGEGSLAWTEVLGTVDTFLSNNTTSVVTLLVDSHTSATRLEEATEQHDVEEYLFRDEVDGTWPSFGALIETDQRLVIFSNAPSSEGAGGAGGEGGASGDATFLRPIDRWIRRTRSDATNVGMIDCRVVAGDDDAPFLLLHQHISSKKTGRPSPELALLANAEDVVRARLESCRSLHGTYPTFIALDYFETGDALRVVQTLNRAED